MSLGTLAKHILKNPQGYLHIDHDSKSPIDPRQIYNELDISSLCTEESYVRAVNQIRAISSRRGAYQGKVLIWKSIEEYVKEVSSNFKNNNQLDNQIKGLYGCSLPKNMRDMARGMMGKRTVKVNNVSTNSEEIRDLVSISFEGLDFTLSKGSSITVGEVKTKTLNFKGLESVHISKIEGGSIHGLTLNA